MRLIEQYRDVAEAKLKPRLDDIERLEGWLTLEIEDAFSARFEQERRWTEALKMYEGVPREPIRDTPIEGAKVIEIPLGAISSDAIYAQAIDTIFSISPVLTVRAVSSEMVDQAAALQRLVNWTVANELNFRGAGEECILDDVQLGTGILYVPWVESIRRTRSSRVTMRAPRMFSVAPENFLVAGGADSDLQMTSWCAMRTWLSEGEYRDRVAQRGWKDLAVKVGMVDWVRTQREQLGGTTSSRKVTLLYEILFIHAYFDINGDGFDEDLLVIWDRSSRRVLKVGYAPFDARPYSAMRYQLRPHLFYGAGVMEMVRPFEEEATEVHFHRLLNMLLANSRIFVGREGVVNETMRLWPGKFIPTANPREDIQSLPISDVYASAFQAEAIPISMSERRVGLNDLAMPRASQVLGSRTPGITAISLLQQASRRFTPAFDGMRLALAGAVRQGLYRYQERLLTGDRQVEDHLTRVLDEDARMTIGLLRSDEFAQAIEIELTASSASTNREAERQNSVQILNVLLPYYDKTLQLAAVAVAPTTPPPLQKLAQKIAGATAKLMERTLLTFDQVRDPRALIVNLDEELDRMVGPMQGDQLAGLQQLLSMAGQGMVPGAQQIQRGMSGMG